MKKIFFIFLLFFGALLLLLQYRGFFSVQASYEDILSEALARNNPEKIYDQEVIFVASDYISPKTYTSQDNMIDINNLGSTQEFNIKNYLPTLGIGETGIRNTKIYGFEENESGIGDISSSENTSSRGNFGGPSFEKSTVQYNESCEGLFFDPCIVIGTQYGGTEGNWKLRASGTPIYRNPEDIR